ncbi:hypothetical protein Z946_3603 [Sulfitobacter noctilucicola]|nr:hypothetical protein Z946_3603 [Sulfitobacter noctilucicola]
MTGTRQLGMRAQHIAAEAAPRAMRAGMTDEAGQIVSAKTGHI